MGRTSVRLANPWLKAREANDPPKALRPWLLSR